MPFDTWFAFYRSDLQSPYLLCVLPFAFLVARALYRPAAARALEPAAHGFITRYALVFALLTIADPFFTGPISRALGIDGQNAGTLVMFFFVVLGDYRVLALVFGLVGPERGAGLQRALGWSFAVPLITGFLYGSASLLIEGLPSQWMWLIYELSFAGLALYLSRAWLPMQLGAEREAMLAYLQSALAYSAAYYLLWATADVMILSGLDEGWGVRVIPNQLYYAGFVPFVVWRFYASPANAAR